MTMAPVSTKNHFRSIAGALVLEEIEMVTNIIKITISQGSKRFSMTFVPWETIVDFLVLSCFTRFAIDSKITLWLAHHIEPSYFTQ
jgi:hypothetical protein